MAQAPAQPEEHIERPALSIVAFDDDPDFLEYITTLLTDENHDLRTAATTDEFFQLCEDRLPDLVLLDMNMGPVRGVDVLAEIRQRWPRLCVIVVTGYASLENMCATFKQDVFDYLTKPFSIQELRATLTQAAAHFGLGQRPQDRLRAELGRQIRLARTERGWTLKDLSNASTVSVSQLSSIERGAHLPSLESLLLIAQALNHTPSAWLSGSGF